MNSAAVLAVHHGHNASVAVVVDGLLTFAVQEERLAYEKNYTGWPSLAIDLAQAHLRNAGVESFDLVFAGARPSVEKIDKSYVVASYRRVRKSMLGLRFLAGRLFYQGGVQARVDRARRKKLAGTVMEQSFTVVDHHRCHAAAAYYGLRESGEERYLVLTADGMGDGVSSTVQIAEAGKLRTLHRNSGTDSLGAIYAWVTFLMGFEPLEHEYKLMGMAGYAKLEHVREIADKFHTLLEVVPGTMRMASRYGGNHSRLASAISDIMDGQRFDNICGGLQLFTEEIMQTWVENCVRETGIRDVLCGGGLFMNVKANFRLAMLDCVDSLNVFPSCGDETNSIGAAFEHYFQKTGKIPQAITHFYLGPTVEREEIVSALAKTSFKYEELEDPEARVARLIVQGAAVACVRGPMEFGARALCNRSILCDPRDTDLIRVLNHAVKKRDFWMPFAPVMRHQDHTDYIVNSRGINSPYMMMAFPTTERRTEFMAAVHNMDLTARAQIVSEAQNPQVHKLISDFHTLTGRGVLLNTSYNLHGWPIVLTAHQAIDVFESSGLMYLQLGQFLVSKS